MRFLTNIIDSVYSPGFYATMRERRGVTAVAHLLLVALICAALYLVLIFPALRIVSESVTAFPEKAFALYPEQMVFSVNDGVASVMGAEEPVIIPVFDIENGFDSGSIPEGVEVDGLRATDVAGKNFIVDTQTPFSIEALRERNGFAWASKDGVYSIDDKGEIKGFAYGKDTKFTLSKTVLSAAIDAIRPYYSYVLPVLSTIVFLFMLIGIWFGYLFFALFIGVLVKIYYSFFLQNSIPFSQSYKTALFAMTGPIFGYTVLSAYGISYTFLFTAATMLVVVINTYAHRKIAPPLTAPSAPAPTAPSSGVVTEEGLN
jgi:hypothetical protein